MEGPEGRARMTNLPGVTVPVVTVLQGPRDVELKRDLVKKITEAFVDAYNCPAEAVQVWIQEVPTDSWGTAGKLTADAAK